MDCSQGRLEGLFGVSVAGIATGIRAVMVGIAEMVLHLPFERRLEDGREDAFDDILDFLCVLGLVGFHDLLGDIVCLSGNHFAFCHVGKALLVDARTELEINQQTWHLHKLLYTPTHKTLPFIYSLIIFEILFYKRKTCRNGTNQSKHNTYSGWKRWINLTTNIGRDDY